MVPCESLSSPVNPLRGSGVSPCNPLRGCGAVRIFELAGRREEEGGGRREEGGGRREE